MIGDGNNKDCEEWFFDSEYFKFLFFMFIKFNFWKVILISVVSGSLC